MQFSGVHLFSLIIIYSSSSSSYSSNQFLNPGPIANVDLFFSFGYLGLLPQCNGYSSAVVNRRELFNTFETRFLTYLLNNTTTSYFILVSIHSKAEATVFILGVFVFHGRGIVNITNRGGEGLSSWHC